MKVSIVTVTYNSAKTIHDTLRSVEEQTHQNIEHIIVDGKSSDNTLALISKNNNCIVISESDKGIYDAMNKGIAMATGDIIGILNSDDYLADKNAIARIVSKFKETQCDALYGDLLYVHPENTSYVKRRWIAGDFKRKKFLRGWMPPHPTFYVKKDLYSKYGLFNIELKSSADYDLLLRFLFVHEVKVEYLPGILIHMRAGGHSNRSLSNRFKAHMEDYKAWKLNLQNPHWYTLMLKPLRKVNQYWVKNRDISIPRNFSNSNR